MSLASVAPDGPAEWVGRDLASIAADLGREPFDVVADLMVSQGGQVGQLVDQISGRGERIETLLAILTASFAAGNISVSLADILAFAATIAAAFLKDFPLLLLIRVRS